MAFDLIEEPQTTPEAEASLRRRPAFVMYIVLALAIPIGFALGGATSTFANAGLTYAPFVVLAVLAYLGLNNPGLRVMSVLWLLLMFAGGALVTVGFSLVASGGGLITPTGSPAEMLTPELLATMAQVSLGVLGALVIGALGFIPAVRHGLSAFLPLEPNSFVHMIALVAVVAFTLISIVPLLVLGEPPLLSSAIMDNIPADALDDTDGLLATLYTLIWSIPVAILAVGYGIRRNFSSTLQRLGFVRPSLTEIVLGIGIGVVLALFIIFIEDSMTSFWQRMSWPETDAEAFSKLIAFAFTPLGAVVVAVSAGVGEELAVRGVLQPRLGILLSNLFFTSLHAFQYNWDALLIVFLVGTVLGILRRYTNTSTSAIAHGIYDFALIMLAIYEVELF